MPCCSRHAIACQNSLLPEHSTILAYAKGDRQCVAHAAEAAGLVAAAVDAGVCRFVLAELLNSSVFEDELPSFRQLQAQVLYQLLMLFLDSQPVRCVAVVLGCKPVQTFISSF